MVNMMPAEPRATDDEFRAWLLGRLDFLRALVVLSMHVGDAG